MYVISCTLLEGIFGEDLRNRDIEVISRTGYVNKLTDSIRIIVIPSSNKFRFFRDEFVKKEDTLIQPRIFETFFSDKVNVDTILNKVL